MAVSVKPHRLAIAGFGTGNARNYDDATVPPEALAYIRKYVDAEDSLNIVDMGCGTGIFTRALLGSPEWQSSIVVVRCTDPSEAMRAVLSSTVNDPRVTVADGMFENTGVPSGWADAIVFVLRFVILLQRLAFHWCMDYEAATKEFVRILKPGGVFCVTYSYDNWCSGPAWLKQAYENCVQYQNDTSSGIPKNSTTRWKSIQDFPSYKDNFYELEEAGFIFATDATASTIIKRFLTCSALSVLPDDERVKVTEQLRSIIDRGDGLVWKDESKGIIEATGIASIHVMKKNIPFESEVAN